jgi:hypothetical protein
MYYQKTAAKQQSEMNTTKFDDIEIVFDEEPL